MTFDDDAFARAQAHYEMPPDTPPDDDEVNQIDELDRWDALGIDTWFEYEEYYGHLEGR